MELVRSRSTVEAPPAGQEIPPVGQKVQVGLSSSGLSGQVYRESGTGGKVTEVLYLEEKGGIPSMPSTWTSEAPIDWNRLSGQIGIDLPDDSTESGEGRSDSEEVAALNQRHLQEMALLSGSYGEGSLSHDGLSSGIITFPDSPEYPTDCDDVSLAGTSSDVDAVSADWIR